MSITVVALYSRKTRKMLVVGGGGGGGGGEFDILQRFACLEAN